MISNVIFEWVVVYLILSLIIGIVFYLFAKNNLAFKLIALYEKESKVADFTTRNIISYKLESSLFKITIVCILIFNLYVLFFEQKSTNIFNEYNVEKSNIGTVEKLSNETEYANLNEKGYKVYSIEDKKCSIDISNKGKVICSFIYKENGKNKGINIDGKTLDTYKNPVNIYFLDDIKELVLIKNPNGNFEMFDKIFLQSIDFDKRLDIMSKFILGEEYKYDKNNFYENSGSALNEENKKYINTYKLIGSKLSTKENYSHLIDYYKELKSKNESKKLKKNIEFLKKFQSILEENKNKAKYSKEYDTFTLTQNREQQETLYYNLKDLELFETYQDYNLTRVK